MDDSWFARVDGLLSQEHCVIVNELSDRQPVQPVQHLFLVYALEKG